MFCIKYRNSHLTAVIVLVQLAVCSYCSPASNENSSIGNATRNESMDSEMSKFKDDSKIDIVKSNILVEPLLKFTQNLFGTIRSDKNNVLVSPISVHAALNMLALGAEPNSVTSKELFNGLGYSNITDDYNQAYKDTIEVFKKISKLGLEAIKKAAEEDDIRASRNFDPKPPVVDFYNTIITKSNKPLFDNYSKRAANFYNSGVEQMDPSKPETLDKVLDKVNRWAKEAGFEQKILDAGEFSGDFTAMLLSAVRVQAFWFSDFYEHESKVIFHQFGLKEQPVDGKQLTMSDLSANFVEFCPEDKASFKLQYERTKASLKLAVESNELADLDCRAVNIRLQGNVSFTIFEPRSIAGQGKELGELAHKLFAPNSSRLSVALSVLDSSDTRTSLDFFRMPKFGFESDTDLEGPLKALGMTRMFSRDSSELKHIVQGETLCVDSAKHQAMIDVNKFGLKAAGVTKIRLVPLMAIHRREPIRIEVKNPFIFIIRHNQIPLFIGQLVKLL